MKITDIPKEELEESARFFKAAKEHAKSATLGTTVLVDCPCGGKMMILKSSVNGHNSFIAKCNKCRCEAWAD